MGWARQRKINASKKITDYEMTESEQKKKKKTLPIDMQKI